MRSTTASFQIAPTSALAVGNPQACRFCRASLSRVGTLLVGGSGGVGVVDNVRSSRSLVNFERLRHRSDCCWFTASGSHDCLRPFHVNLAGAGSSYTENRVSPQCKSFYLCSIALYPLTFISICNGRSSEEASSTSSILLSIFHNVQW
jgi:hypothetical protein